MTDLLPSPSSRREVIILDNPVAGTHDHPRQVCALDHALRNRGLTPILCSRLVDLSDLIRKHSSRLRCVVAAGGDGTLNAVLNRAPGLPVAVLPLGNENLVARHFQIGRAAGRLAKAIADDSGQRLDLGRVGDRFFSLMLSIGLDAQVVHEVHRARRGHINKWNYVGPVMRALSCYPFPKLEITIEETGEKLNGAMAFLFNLPVYALDLPVAPAARADDGCLDLLVFQKPGIGNLARYLGALMSRSDDSLPDMQRRRVRGVSIRSLTPVPVQIDGDPAGSLPVTVNVAPAAWHLISPSLA